MVEENDNSYQTKYVPKLSRNKLRQIRKKAAQRYDEWSVSLEKSLRPTGKDLSMLLG